MELNIPFKAKKTILALGPESAGNFSVYKNGRIFLSDDFGDLTDAKNLKAFKSSVVLYLKKHGTKPDVILADLHPLYVTTVWGAGLAKKYKAEYVQVQHHIAHVFSAIGEKKIQLARSWQVDCFGIAMDGTGYGEDGKVWGGEAFQFSINNFQLTIKRIGHLEDQVMIGGDLAVKEPARMVLSILSKFLDKEEVYGHVKKYYPKKEFEVLYSQLENNFNCQETSSTGRILDAVSLLLGFCPNKRNYKHEPAELLEKNSSKPYKIAPFIKGGKRDHVLQTTQLFKYLINNLHRDKKRLAATAQTYIAQGLYEIIKMFNGKCEMSDVYFAGGMANNKIISRHLERQGSYASKKIPRGDAGLSLGQIFYYLTDSRN